MSNEEHSDSEFYYPEEQETAKRKATRRCRHFDKVEIGGDTGVRSHNSSGCIDFRNKKYHIINYLLTSTVRSLQYKISKLGLAVLTSLLLGQ